MVDSNTFYRLPRSIHLGIKINRATLIFNVIQFPDRKPFCGSRLRCDLKCRLKGLGELGETQQECLNRGPLFPPDKQVGRIPVLWAVDITNPTPPLACVPPLC